MILMISGRCDIVAFYTPWLMKRYHDGFVDVRNPFNEKLVNRISFDNVDLILFCTKNPLPIIPYLKEFQIPLVFHITITPYKKDIEPNVINKKRIIEGVKEISKIIGKDNTVVRYDPIFLNDKYNLDYHKKTFSKLCSELNGYINKIIVSFIDDCKNVRNNRWTLKLKEFTEFDYQEIGLSFSKIAKENNMIVQTCFEKRNLVEYGFVKGECLSHELAYKLTGKTYKTGTIRKGGNCNCVQMVDIGFYNSCKHFCKYCYANYDERKVLDNYQKHNKNSSLLIGELRSDDILKERIK